MDSLSSNLPSPGYKIGYGDYLRFRNLILAHSGLYFPERKRLDLETGLLKALAETKAIPQDTPHRLDDYYQLLANRNNLAGRVELERLVNLLTVGETHFFRDEAQFDALWHRVLPELIARKRQMALAAGPNIQPQLRLWSAGCATGEEPYSLAMMLKELLPDLAQWHILILATDINQESLVRAKEGLYSDWSFRENRAKALQWRYFTPEAGNQGHRHHYRLQADIRRMVTFTSLNLIEEEYPTVANNTANMDLVICRNVTIYFTQEDTQRVVNRFYRTLIGGGWLVVGHAEPALYVYREFQARSFPGALLYQKTGQPQPWPEEWAWSDLVKPAEVSLERHQPLLSSRPLNQPGAGAGGGVAPEPQRPFTQLKTVPFQPTPKTQPLPEVSPAQPVDPYTLARTLLEQGKVSEAIHQLQYKLESDPGYVPAHCLLGRAYANLGHWAEARHWCQSALALDNLAAEAYQILGLVHQNNGELDLAVLMLKKAIYLERDNPLLHFNLAALYQKAGEIHLNQRSLENTLRLLDKLPSAEIIPDSGGATVEQLRQVVKKML